ncbi:uncharacterized protein ARMOST_03139 [Armillaria ostoyae]|uniref:Uncharacterized protein n=1 Tax=Armillaria ostoyae TaxID=47428 RepID=A0A284QTM7_ARMOS|nr:uncharacterized protein ARMOST_03139 [Armillaria ostoyae]
MLRSILPRLNISKTKLQPSFVRSRFPRHLCTRTELEGELCDIEEGLETLLDLVRHPKATTFLRAVKDYNSEEHPESSDEDSPPQLCLPPSFHAETYKTGWKYLESSRSNSYGYVDPGEQVLFNGVALVSSLFHNHVQITSNEPIPKVYGVPDPLPLGEPVSYQVKMHNQIKLVVIEQEDLRLPDPEVYTRLFTELYGISGSLVLVHHVEDLIEFKPSDLSLMEEAIQYANLATSQLGSPKDEDGLKRGLDCLRKSAWILPIHGKTNNCWLGLDDDLDQLATKAAVKFRRKNCLEEEEWKDGRRHKTYLYCG